MKLCMHDDAAMMHCDDAGCTILSLDNYNDAARLIDGNFDGAVSGSQCLHLLLHTWRAVLHVAAILAHFTVSCRSSPDRL